MVEQPDNGVPIEEQLEQLRARADAGDRNAAGWLGELLARQGDQEGALQVWARAYGGSSPTTKRLAELWAEQGDLERAVNAWRFSDEVFQNPAGSHAQFLATLDDYGRMEYQDDPEDWAFMEAEQVAALLAERGDEASIAELRARAEAGDPPARAELAKLRPGQDEA